MQKLKNVKCKLYFAIQAAGDPPGWKSEPVL